MTEREFWRLIDESRRQNNPQRADGNMDRQREQLERILTPLSTDDVQAFDRVFRELVNRAYRWDLWGAAYIIASGCSDDSFDYFRFWLISMGEQVYNDALADPESLALSASRPDVEDIFFEEFSYVASTILDERGVEMDETTAWPSEPAGREWKEDDLPKLFPKLWSEYGSSRDTE